MYAEQIADAVGHRHHLDHLRNHDKTSLCTRDIFANNTCVPPPGATSGDFTFKD